MKLRLRSRNSALFPRIEGSTADQRSVIDKNNSNSMELIEIQPESRKIGESSDAPGDGLCYAGTTGGEVSRQITADKENMKKVS